MIAFAMSFGWYLYQVNLVLAYVQTSIEMDMWMDLLDGIGSKGGNNATHVVKLLSNIYG